MSADSQIIESSEIGSVVHSEPFAFPVFDLVLKDVPGQGFEHLDLLVQRGLGDDHDIVQFPLLVLGTS